ncbi:formate dehydrogenase accessory sulfurtransferase FdhD [Cereibacter sphaeroides]|uniref:formate dehydrogenase accessory sulfurtransferase FdhD n=1 Tax=Cereibacter sphaeroides TaxID=1063 RepID=UPI001F390C8A|nr:formate dehydrogenase accessory sulfurtransferase FdhD [Cereibacter sphaeroides]MCE6951140.1 formate dehydrogenase accessory sulfurtransferase FdhD [Cereibacter sphaeroides]
MMETSRLLPRLAMSPGQVEGGSRCLPEEVAIALTFNGSTQAVMMATPADLEDFAAGFALTEGFAQVEEIDSITPVEVARGIDLQIWLRPAAEARLAARRRRMAGPVGCGLCGIDSLDEALRDPPPVPDNALRLTVAQAAEAVSALTQHQPLHDATRAVHAAGFWMPGLGMVAAREDVGRHNALDKLAGALVRRDTATAAGAVVLTSRVSIDLVQKCARLGSSMLIAVSAPTAHAVRMAEAAGITLVALARGGRCEVFSHPHRIHSDEAAHVA